VDKNVGSGVYSAGFGHKGSGAQAFTWDSNRKIGVGIRTAANLRTVNDGTEISAALRFLTFEPVSKQTINMTNTIPIRIKIQTLAILLSKNML
jgi:hypothetical protein